MTQDDERELLQAFAAWMGARVAADPEGERGEWTDAGVQAQQVEAFLKVRHPGALGYSDDELKGTARDGG